MEEEFTVGIDPQQLVLAMCIIRNPDNVYKVYEKRLKKRTIFGSAQEWQEYLIDQVKEVVASLPSNTKCIGIEQQRGRINSIIEHTFLMECKRLGKNIIILHPLKWKRLTNQACHNSNKKNKKEIINSTWPLIEKHFTGESLRFHDPCDAYHISQAAYFLTEGTNNGKTNSLHKS